MIAGILRSLYKYENITFSAIKDIESSFLLAKSLRNRGNKVVDLQQLNCFVDYPKYNYLFDSGIDERAKYDWLDAYAIKQWGLQRFEEIFRSMLQIPKTRSHCECKIFKSSKRSKILLFPHCETVQQQYLKWETIVQHIGKRTDKFLIVGKKGALKQLTLGAENYWIEAKSGNELIKIISEARICIGGATGLSHISCEMEIPTFFIWCYNDYEIFKPSKEDNAEVVFSCTDLETDILKKALSFIERHSIC